MRVDNLLPAVIAFDPDLETEGVSVRPVITIRFNTPLLVAQVTDNESLNQVVILTQESSDGSIPVSFVAYQNKILKIVPTADLEPGGTYQVTVLRGILSEDGRPAISNRSFSFKVSQTLIPRVTLYSPPDCTSLSSVTGFSWSSVTVSGSPASGTYYHIQLDTTLAFNTVGSHGWETLTQATNAVPGLALSAGTTYFWRVRAETHTLSASSIGQWSEPFQVYYGSTLEPSPSTRQTYPDSVTFRVVRSTVVHGQSNQQDWPELRFKFSTEINASTVTSDNVLFTKESIDGYPDSWKKSVSCNLTVLASTLVITPNEGMVPNNRYTITITDDVKDVNGNSIPGGQEYYFTSRYTPYYVGVNTIRANFGALIVDYPDDFINMQIFRTSLEANRKWIIVYTIWGGATEEQVRNLVAPRTYDIEKWVEHETTARVLQAKYFELMEEADSQRRLADFEVKRGVNVLAAMREEITHQKKLADLYEANFARDSAGPRNVVKSENWPASFAGNDRSWIPYTRRGKF